MCVLVLQYSGMYEYSTEHVCTSTMVHTDVSIHSTQSALDKHPGVSLFHKHLLILSELLGLLFFVVHPLLCFLLSTVLLTKCLLPTHSPTFWSLLLLCPTAFNSGGLHEHGLGCLLDYGEFPEATSLKSTPSSPISLLLPAG